MEEKEDVRLEMVPLIMDDSIAIRTEVPGAIVVESGFPNSSIGLAGQNEVDSEGHPVAHATVGVGGLFHESESTTLISAALERRLSEKFDNLGGRDVHPKEVAKDNGSRDFVRAQKTRTNDLTSRDAFSPEARTSFNYNESVGRGVGLVSDEDFDREFGTSPSGGSGQSTPKRRNGSRGRSTGTSRWENGLGGDSFKETILKGSLIDALKANAVDLSPRSRISMGAKDHDITFFDFEAVAESRPPARNPLIATVVKTIFIILIWYTFSTCLTL